MTPSQKDALKEKWTEALKDKTMFMKDVYSETFDWWMLKFDHLLASKAAQVRGLKKIDVQQTEKEMEWIADQLIPDKNAGNWAYNQALSDVERILQGE